VLASRPENQDQLLTTALFISGGDFLRWFTEIGSYRNPNGVCHHASWHQEQKIYEELPKLDTYHDVFAIYDVLDKPRNRLCSSFHAYRNLIKTNCNCSLF